MSKNHARENLTNEYLKKNFTDNFTLALSAIDIGRNLIDAGKEFNLSGLLNGIAKKEDEQEVAEIEEEANKITHEEGL